MRTGTLNCRGGHSSAESVEKKMSDLGVRILENCRNELCSLFPYLDGAFACLTYWPLREQDCDAERSLEQPASEPSGKDEQRAVSGGDDRDARHSLEQTESEYSGADEQRTVSGEQDRDAGHNLEQTESEPSGSGEQRAASDEENLKTPGKIGTEGNRLIFSPGSLAQFYVKDPEALRRGYLHILLHCLYLHPFREDLYKKNLWNLACDMAVEQVIRRTQAFSSGENPVKERCLQILGDHSVSAEQLYDMLKSGCFPFSGEELKQAFCFDDHSFWEGSGDGEKKASSRKKWEKVIAYTGQNKKDRKQKAGTKQGSDEEELEEVQKSRYDYSRFLKRFAVLREEVELDEDSFDYIPYYFGMEHYGNLPFVEPLEYKEVHRLEELVIAIDTSGSCSAATVQQFLAETYAILSEKENFFRKMKVYILQCDCYVQDAAVIRSREEWDDYSKNIHIHGRGGTDFRPVFRYVKELQEKKELKNLKALIYFTDGDGIYPREQTGYETAFVFLNKTVKMEMAPSWARKLIVGRGVSRGE